MHRLVPIPCKTCGDIFMPKSEKNVFCSRRCFKRDFYHRKKLEELTGEEKPVFRCPYCGKETMLDFSPIEESDRWLAFECPNCDALMMCISGSPSRSPSTSVSPSVES